MEDDSVIEITLTPVIEFDDDGITLADWVREDDQYSRRLTETSQQPNAGELGVGELVLTGVFSASSLAGLFAFLRTWILTRKHAVIRVKLKGSSTEIEYDGRDPKLAVEMLRALRDKNVNRK